MKNIFTLFFLFLFSLVQAQEIKPEKEGLSFLDDSDIKHINILSEDSETLLISVELKKNKGKRLLVTGTLLGKTKKELQEINSEPQEIAKNSSSVDLSFNVSKKNTSGKSSINSSYVSIKIKQIDGEEEE